MNTTPTTSTPAAVVIANISIAKTDSSKSAINEVSKVKAVETELETLSSKSDPKANGIARNEENERVSLLAVS